MFNIKRLHLLFLFTLCFLVSCDDDDFSFKNCMDGDRSTASKVIFLPAGITAFDLAIEADVILTKGPIQEITIEGEANIIENIETNIRSNSWDIDFDRCVDKHDPITIYMTIETLQKITVSGEGDVTGTNNFDQSGSLELIVSGEGNINLSMEATELTARISGEGDLELQGSAISQDVRISGEGDYDGFGLLSDDCKVTVSGEGDCEVTVSNDLEVIISGESKVYYKGDPKITSTITGEGKLINAN